jgi:hypothetical protein
LEDLETVFWSVLRALLGWDPFEPSSEEANKLDAQGLVSNGLIPFGLEADHFKTMVGRPLPGQDISEHEEPGHVVEQLPDFARPGTGVFEVGNFVLHASRLSLRREKGKG